MASSRLRAFKNSKIIGYTILIQFIAAGLYMR